MTQAIDILPALPYQPAAIENAAKLWAESTTRQTSAAPRNLLTKQATVRDFFEFVNTHPARVTPMQVAEWRDIMARNGAADSTVYQKISFLSSFYYYLMQVMPGTVRTNPAAAARPRQPRPYHSDKTKALSDDEMRRLFEHVRRLANDDKAPHNQMLTHCRDYAMLCIFLKRGMRRESVVALRAGDVVIAGDHIEITADVKGGHRRVFELNDADTALAIRTYWSRTGGRSNRAMPMWLAHARNSKPGQAVTSSAVAQNMKRYAAAAGIPQFWLHRTRHTYARIVADDQRLVDAQDALDHENAQTTKVYAGAVTVRRDRGYSASVTERLNT